MPLFRGVPTIEDTGDQAMTTLYHQWYNAVVAGLRLDPGTFQLIQPNTPLGATSDTLWAYFNSIPPASLLCNFELNGLNRLYDDYVAVVNRLVSQTGDQLRIDLGDSYQAWLNYVGGLNPAPDPNDLPNIFFSWATVHAPSVASRGRNDIAAILDDPIALAQQAATNKAGFLNGMPNFSATIQDLRGAVQRAPAASFSFDSATQSADTTYSWAQQTVGGFWDFFAAEGSGNWDKIQSKAATSHLTMAVSFDHAMTAPATPGAWYNSAAMTAAYGTRDNTVWQPGTPNWNTTFGPTGAMQRFVTQLVVVDGIDLTMTSLGDYDSREQQDIRAHADAGLFPIFSARAAGGFSSTITFDSSGTMTVTGSSPAGNPVVVGVTVASASELLGGQAIRAARR
jgi:hypothetical protein